MKSNRGLDVTSPTVVGVVDVGLVSVVVSSVCLNLVFASSTPISLFISGTASKDLNKLTPDLLFSSIIFASVPTLKKFLACNLF